MSYIFWIENCNLLILKAPIRMHRRRLQLSKREHPALQKFKTWKFFTFFYICGSFMLSGIDPATQINADPDPQPWLRNKFCYTASKVWDWYERIEMFSRALRCCLFLRSVEVFLQIWGVGVDVLLPRAHVQLYKRENKYMRTRDFVLQFSTVIDSHHSISYSSTNTVLWLSLSIRLKLCTLTTSSNRTDKDIFTPCLCSRGRKFYLYWKAEFHLKYPRNTRFSSPKPEQIVNFCPISKP